MSMIDGRTVASFLAMLGVYPDTDPGKFDRLGRELCEWWARGGSCREFVEQHRTGGSRALLPEAEERALLAEAEKWARPVPDWRTATTFEQRMAVLRRRYVPEG